MKVHELVSELMKYESDREVVVDHPRAGRTETDPSPAQAVIPEMRLGEEPTPVHIGSDATLPSWAQR